MNNRYNNNKQFALGWKQLITEMIFNFTVYTTFRNSLLKKFDIITLLDVVIRICPSVTNSKNEEYYNWFLL